jgi:hypothetical protein
MSSQLTETSDMLTRRRELLEASGGMTSPAQSRSSAAAGTILAKGKNRQGTTTTDLADLWTMLLHRVSSSLYRPR